MATHEYHRQACIYVHSGPGETQRNGGVKEMAIGRSIIPFYITKPLKYLQSLFAVFSFQHSTALNFSLFPLAFTLLPDDITFVGEIETYLRKVVDDDCSLLVRR